MDKKEIRSGSAGINGEVKSGTSGIEGEDKKRIIEKIVIVLVLGYGLHYLGSFIRTRYYGLLGSMALDEGLAHALLYLGHLIFFAIMMIYAWAVHQDRRYFFSFRKGSAADKLKYGALGILSGAFLMGSCVFAASMHGDYHAVPWVPARHSDRAPMHQKRRGLEKPINLGVPVTGAVSAPGGGNPFSCLFLF